MTYTPYNNGGGCKTADQVMSDIGKIHGKGFVSVRTYSTDCAGLENIGNACKSYGMKMILGVYIDNKGLGAAQSQVSDIVNWGQWDLVEMIVLGNEAIFNQFVDVGSLAGFLSSSKSTFQGAGYHGPVTTTEPLNILQEVGHQLCDHMDAVAANIQAFFNSGVAPHEAGNFVATQLDIVQSICPNLPAYNLECGWPKQGSANGAATPGYDAQKTAISDIIEKAGSKSVIFSFEDDDWKADGAFGVEKFFGCADLF
jgi:exo-beta-1,3-glucanase (GH17 family)